MSVCSDCVHTTALGHASREHCALWHSRHLDVTGTLQLVQQGRSALRARSFQITERGLYGIFTQLIKCQLLIDTILQSCAAADPAIDRTEYASRIEFHAWFYRSAHGAHVEHGNCPITAGQCRVKK